MASEVEKAAAAANAVTADTSSSTSKADRQYWVGAGATTTTTPVGIANKFPELTAGTVASVGKVAMTKDQVVLELQSLSRDNPAAYQAVTQNLVNIGALYSMRYANSLSSVGTAVGLALDIYGSGDQKVSFSDWLSAGRTGTAAAAGGGGSGGGSGGGAYTGPTRSTSTTLTDKTSAEGVLQQFSRDMLGRNLTLKEVDKYTTQLNAQEKANPQVSVNQSGRGYSNSVGTTAPDKQQILHNIISKNADYIPNQIDTTVMDFFVKRIQNGQAVING